MFLPKIVKDAVICGLNKRACYEKLEDEFPNHESQCDCLPTCDRLEYSFEVMDLNVEA